VSSYVHAGKIDRNRVNGVRPNGFFKGGGGSK
jgi:hypothetical protein